MQDPGSVPSPEYKDRRTGLIIFGILHVLVGVFTLLGILFILLGVVVANTKTAGQISLDSILLSLATYLALTVSFIWLGIGSILCRRWACALIQILAWLCLIVGCVSVPMSALTTPTVLAHQRPGMAEIPEAMKVIIMFVSICVASVIYIVIPAVVLLFYRSPHVKATCQVRDPETRWTDKCPLPALGLSVTLALGAAVMPLIVVSGKAVVPCFTFFIGGTPAVVILLLMAAIYGYAARAVYRLQMSGWWCALAVYCVFAISMATTIGLVGIMPMYELMKMSPTQLAMLREMDFLRSPWFVTFTTLSSLPFIAFIVYTRKYFLSPTANQTTNLQN